MMCDDPLPLCDDPLPLCDDPLPLPCDDPLPLSGVLLQCMLHLVSNALIGWPFWLAIMLRILSVAMHGFAAK